MLSAAAPPGDFAAVTRAARSPRTTLAVISALLAVAVPLVPVLGGFLPGAVALLALWGLAYGGVSVSTQTWVGVALAAGALLAVWVGRAPAGLGRRS